MSVRSAQSITADFVTQRFDTGNATAADSLPVGTLVVNGTDDAATVTVTNKTGGKYKAAVTLPTLAFGDVVQIRVAATVNSVAGIGVVWTDTKDIDLDANGEVTPDATSIRDSVGLSSANLDTQLSAIDDAIDTEVVAILTAVDTEIADILADTTALSGDWADGGRLDVILDFVAADAAAIKTVTDQFVFTVANQVDANALSGGGGLDAAGVRAAVGLATANLDTQIGDLPTNAELVTALGTADDAVLAAIATVQADADDIQSRLPAALSGGNMKCDVLTLSGSATAADNSELFFDGTGYNAANSTIGTATTAINLTNAPTNGDLTATMKASVNAEVLDVLNVDTFAEVSKETPAATTTMRKMLSLLYKAWRNKKTQTENLFSLYADDATTVDQQSTVSDDNTTTTIGEITAGP